MSSVNISYLLQQQMEVCGSLRERISNPQKLLETKESIQNIVDFLLTIDIITSKAAIKPIEIFQCFMQMGTASNKSFDSQHREGNVPMHQAKVLDRAAQLQANNIEPIVRNAINDEGKIVNMVDTCCKMRRILRIKIEDGNDLTMAKKMVRTIHTYLESLYTATKSNIVDMYALFAAATEEEARAIISKYDDVSSTSNSLYLKTDVNDEIGFAKNNISPDGLIEDEVELPSSPQEFVKSLKEKCSFLGTGTEPVNLRQSALNLICKWIQTVNQNIIEENFLQIMAILNDPIKVHLREKRSALLRVAALIVSFFFIRAPSLLLVDGSSNQSSNVKEIASSWLDILIKGVHVTVSAIATATDETVRDIIITTHGASYIFKKLLSSLVTAAQPELRRKLLNYLCICMIVTNKFSMSQYNIDFVANISVIKKVLRSSEIQTRKVARWLCILAIKRNICNDIYSIESDAKIIKNVEADLKEFPEQCLTSIDDLEITLLGYDVPSKSSLYWQETIGLDNSNIMKGRNSLNFVDTIQDKNSSQSTFHSSISSNHNHLLLKTPPQKNLISKNNQNHIPSQNHVSSGTNEDIFNGVRNNQECLDEKQKQNGSRRSSINQNYLKNIISYTKNPEAKPNDKFFTNNNNKDDNIKSRSKRDSNTPISYDTSSSISKVRDNKESQHINSANEYDGSCKMLVDNGENHIIRDISTRISPAKPIFLSLQKKPHSLNLNSKYSCENKKNAKINQVVSSIYSSSKPTLGNNNGNNSNEKNKNFNANLQNNKVPTGIPLSLDLVR